MDLIFISISFFCNHLFINVSSCALVLDAYMRTSVFLVSDETTNEEFSIRNFFSPSVVVMVARTRQYVWSYVGCRYNKTRDESYIHGNSSSPQSMASIQHHIRSIF